MYMFQLMQPPDNPILPTATKMPSRKGYLFAFLVFVAGAALAFSIMFYELDKFSSGLLRFRVPGSIDVAVKEPADFTVFHEERSMVDGRPFVTSGDLSDIRCSLTEKGSGAKLELAKPNSNTTYSLNNVSGSSVLQFHAPRAGVVTLSCTTDRTEQSSSAVFAVGQSGLMSLILVIFLFFFGGFFLACWMALRTYKARIEFKIIQRLQSTAVRASS